MKSLLNKIRFVFAKKYYIVYSSHYLLGNKILGIFYDKKEVDRIVKYYVINSDSKCSVVECIDLNKLLVRLDNV